MIDYHHKMEQDHAPTVSQASSVDHSMFSVGMIVEVMPRLWPGINKQGGVARVVKVSYSEGNHQIIVVPTRIHFFIKFFTLFNGA